MIRISRTTDFDFMTMKPLSDVTKAENMRNLKIYR